MAKTGYNNNESIEISNKTCSRLLPEEREVILIMDLIIMIMPYYIEPMPSPE